MPWNYPNVCHIGILHLVSILTISPQSTCHSAPVCKILSKSDHPQHKKMTSCRFSRWPFSAILDFKGPIMGSLKSPCTNSSRSSIDTVALNCLVFWENHIFLAFLRQIDKQTNEQMDTTDALSRSRYREQRLNKFAKNCCKRTVLVQVIIEDIVTFFFGRPCIYNYPRF